ncbi:cell division ATP-binding protein FtsE [bacterium]|nr:MAG: cell division ATP-binding protein FtsE [bacterium]
MVRFDRVVKRYRTQQGSSRDALAGLSFDVAPGEMAFLTGRSGAGKSSVLKLIGLLERPTRGQVLVNGRSTATLKLRHVPAFRRQIGMVFQDHRLLTERSIYDNVALPLIVAHTPFREIDKRVRASLDQVGLLDRIRSLPQELSVGEQQRVGIARAVVSKPPLLIADEPTGNLDPQLSREVMALFRRFSEVGVTVLIASHDLALVKESGLREIRLADGRLAGDAIDELPPLAATR